MKDIRCCLPLSASPKRISVPMATRVAQAAVDSNQGARWVYAIVRSFAMVLFGCACVHGLVAGEPVGSAPTVCTSEPDCGADSAGLVACREGDPRIQIPAWKPEVDMEGNLSSDPESGCGRHAPRLGGNLFRCGKTRRGFTGQALSGAARRAVGGRVSRHFDAVCGAVWSSIHVNYENRG